MSEEQLTPEQVQEAGTRALHHNYLQRVLTGVDDFANVLAGGNLDETISARAERLAAKGNEFAKLLSWGLGKIQPQHGELAEAGDLARAKSVEQTEQQALEKPTENVPTTAIGAVEAYLHPMEDAVHGSTETPAESKPETLGDA